MDSMVRFWLKGVSRMGFVKEVGDDICVVAFQLLGKQNLVKVLAADLELCVD